MTIGSYLYGGVEVAKNVYDTLHEQAAAVTGQIKDSTSNQVKDSDPLAFRTISYPRDITNNMANGHYMLFYVNVQNKTKYRYRDANNEGQWVCGKTEIMTENVHGKRTYEYVDAERLPENELSYQKNLIAKGGIGNVNLGGDAVFLAPNVPHGFAAAYPTTTRITDSVAMYLPADVSDTLNAEYRGIDTGILGLLAAGAGSFMSNMRRNDFEAAAGALLGSAKSLAEEATRRVGGELADMLSGAEAGSAVGLASKAFGQAVNPYMEVLFDQVKLRSYQYKFSFTPKNQQETADVQAIIKLFRFHMMPELKGKNHRFLTLPSTFDIHYMYQHSKDYASENNFYSKIATCVLSGVTVNYTPDEKVKSFQSGAPVRITMDLSFKETELMTKERINEGY